VLTLRRLGFEIHTASINLPDRPESGLTVDEKNEAAHTLYVKNAGLGTVLAAHARTLLKVPMRYLDGLLYALHLAGADLKAMLYLFFYFVEAVVVGDWMSRKDVSHLHIHFATPAATVGMIASHIFPIEFSMTVHGPDEFYAVKEHFLKEKIEQAKFICTIGRYCRSQLMKLSDRRHWKKMEISPLGIDPEHFAYKPRMARSDCFRIICVGRLVDAKGQAILLEATARLLKEHRKVSLTLVGDGPDSKRLQETTRELGISEEVHFTGPVNQDRIRELYRNADVFVLPSFAEGIPVVLMEAMALGLPCISTAITGIPELIRSGKEGILVPPSDAGQLADAIAQLMESPELAMSLAEEARKKVCEEYNLERNVERLARIFQQRLASTAEAKVTEKVFA